MKLTLFAAVAMALCQAQAAEPFDAASLAAAGDLPTVIITASMPLPSVAQARDAIAAPVQTASAQQIARSGALDLSAFLRRNLGSVVVNEVQNNPFQPDVSYRGYTASPLLGTPQGLSVYLDGMRLNQPFGDVVSWDLIPRMAIDSLTLMPGSNPLFGLNTLGGALAIQTKDGRSHAGSAIEARLGSDKRRAVEFEHGGSNAQGWHWYVTGNRFKEDGWRDDSPSDVRQLFGKLGWNDARTDIAATLAHADNALTGNGLQEQRMLARDYRSVYTKPDLTQNKATLLNLTAKHQASEALLLSGNVYYRKINTHTFNGDLNDASLDQSIYQPGAAERAALAAAGYTGYPASGANAANTPFPKWRCIGNVLLKDEPAEKCNGMLNRSHTEQENYGFSGQFTLQSEVAGQRHAVTAGAAYDTSHATFRQTSQFGYLNPDRSITPVDFFADGTQINDDGTPVDNRVDLSGRMRTWSVYASDSIALNQALTLTVSGRYNRSTVRNRDAITPGGGSGSLDGDHRFSRFNPAIGLAYAPAAGVGAYLGYNEGSRTPTAIELGCADPENPCRLPNAMAGDPPLKQVVTKTWEAGLRGKLGSITSWSAGVFRAENHDDILFVADNQAGFGYFKNFGKTRHQGVELAADGKAGALDFGVNYTWLQATYQSREIVNGSANSSSDADAPGLEGNIVITPGKRIPLTPSHILKAHVDYQGGRDWTLGLAMTAVSSAYARGNENNLHQPGGLAYLGSGKSAGYAVFDLTGKYQLTPKLSVFAQVSNLFDRQYATAAQLGATGFDANGNFAARPLPAVGGEYPMVNATFYAAGAPRAINVGLRYAF
ncbi:TonB-dependent receptor [Janthinobacterium sp. HLX7-2]|uniref:TonB-dependent receptor n=1 Tax=Janthinobacterium sp. HLX7-2 TaxID=1259331 RepID=UPI003F28E1A6